MATPALSRNQRLYLQQAASFGVVPNSSGTASVAAGDACRFMRFTANNDTGLLEDPDKTGTRSMGSMTGGRKSGRWESEMALRANGTAGQLPDCDPLLVALFGQTASVGSGTASISSSTDATPIVVTCGGAHGIASGSIDVVSIAGHLTNTACNGVWLAYAPSTSTLTLIGSVGSGLGAGSGGTVSLVKVSYTLSDTIQHFSAWTFRETGMDHQCVNTGVLTDATFSLGQDVATWSASGSCLWVIRSKDFSNLDATQKGGLTAFPTEPASPTTNGSITPGFTGRFTVGKSVAATSHTAAAFATAAVTLTAIRNGTIRFQTQNNVILNTFGSYYGTSTEGGVRNVSVSFESYDDDSAAIEYVKALADSKTQCDFVLCVGSTVGAVWLFHVKNVYLQSHTLGDGELRFTANFGEGRATASTLAVKDEIALHIA